MKKNILFAVLLVVCLINVQAPNLLDVNTSSTVNLSVDFSEAYIHGLCEDEFFTYEPDYTCLKSEVIGLLAEESNECKRVNLMIGDFPKPSYTVNIKIVSVSSKGNVTTSYTDVIDEKDNVIVKSEMYGDGFIFGSKMNLMGGGFKSTDKVLAEKLAKNL